MEFRTEPDPAYRAFLAEIETTRRPVNHMGGCGGTASFTRVMVAEPDVVLFQGDVVGSRPKTFEEGREGTWYPGHGWVRGNPRSSR